MICLRVLEVTDTVLPKLMWQTTRMWGFGRLISVPWLPQSGCASFLQSPQPGCAL